MIPSFTEKGTLPEGIHQSTFEEVEQFFGWNERRKTLLWGLRAVLENLKQAGCKWVYLNGSFVTNKDEPSDFDVCWEPSVGMDFKKIDPVLLDFSNGRAAQKVKYGGEAFPATLKATVEGVIYRDFFQLAKGGGRKGIVVIHLDQGFS